MINEKSFVIATPMYGGVCHVQYVAGLLDTVNICVSEGYKVYFLAVGNDSLITRARNELVHKFLASEANYLIFVDADIGFKAKDILKLIDSRKDVICGLYPKKMIDWNAVELAAANGHKNLKNYAASYVINKLHDFEERENIIEIKHGGTGFMLIKRSVFESLAPFVKQYRTSTIKNKHGETPHLVKEFFATSITDEDNYHLSEDYWFCELWRKYGGKVFADLSIELTHSGTHEFHGNVKVAGLNIL
jgi:hypothetical protein